MLHMIVNTHNSESSAFRGDAEEEGLVTALTQINEQAPDDGSPSRARG